MIEYKIIALNDDELFQETITNLLADGWQLHGNLVVTRHLLRDGDFDECFYQGMTRVAPT